MSNFIAIDFETANSQRCSICAVGLVEVEDGQIVRTFETLVRPKLLKFNKTNINIHGITPDDVRDKPKFDALWKELGPQLEGKTLVAHYAPFDMSCLAQVLDLYDLPYPNIRYYDSCDIARAVWPGWKNYKLPTVATQLKISLDHHNACQDAMACAQIVLTACRAFGVSGLDELGQRIRIKPQTLVKGKAIETDYRPRRSYEPVRIEVSRARPAAETSPVLKPEKTAAPITPAETPVKQKTPAIRIVFWITFLITVVTILSYCGSSDKASGMGGVILVLLVATWLLKTAAYPKVRRK